MDAGQSLHPRRLFFVTHLPSSGFTFSLNINCQLHRLVWEAHKTYILGPPAALDWPGLALRSGFIRQCGGWRIAPLELADALVGRYPWHTNHLQTCIVLAVQNSSIGDLVTWSLGTAPLTIRVFTTLQSDPRDLWPWRHLIRVMMRHDLTKKDNDKDEDKDNYKYKDI